MKRHLRTALFIAFHAVLIAAATFESDQVKQEPEESKWKENFIVPHVYLEIEIIPSSIAYYVVLWNFDEILIRRFANAYYNTLLTLTIFNADYDD